MLICTVIQREKRGGGGEGGGAKKGREGGKIRETDMVHRTSKRDTMVPQRTVSLH